MHNFLRRYNKFTTEFPSIVFKSTLYSFMTRVCMKRFIWKFFAFSEKRQHATVLHTEAAESSP